MKAFIHNWPSGGVPFRRSRLQELVARMMDLYKQITDKALQNERASH